MIKDEVMPWLVTTGIPVLCAPAFLLAFMWLSLAVGRRCLRLLGAGGCSVAERGVAALALGSGVLQFVPFLLGAAGVLSVHAIWIALALVGLLVARDLIRVLAVVRSLWQARASLAMPRWVLALAPGLLAAFLLALTPTLDADGLGYHLTVPKRWLSVGSLSYLPTYPNSNMPMGVEMLFTLALAIAGDTAAKLLHFAFGLSGAVGLYLAGLRLSGKHLGMTAVALYLIGPVGVGSLLGWAYLEGATSFASIAATLAWLIWLRDRQNGWLYCAFALAGVGVSFKITAGLFPVGLAALTVVISIGERPSAPAAQQPPWLTLAALSILPVTPWLARSALVTGNPFFPLFSNLLPSRDFSAEQSAQWQHFNRYLNWAIRVGANWTIEQRQLILVGSGLLCLAIASVICLRQRTWLARAITLVLVGIVLLQLGAVGLYIRYWIPVMSVLQLPILLLLEPLIVKRSFQLAIVGLTTLASLVQARRILTSGTVPADVVKTALGLRGQRAFLMKTMPPFPLYERANRDLPASSGILLAAYCGGFYLDRRTFCADIVQDSLRLGSWQAFTDDVHRLGITHVVAPRSMLTAEIQPDEAAGVGFMIHQREFELIGRLLREQGVVLGSAGDQALYELAPRKAQ
jgi:Dolichyl-phosphate-mannose-protein mannosyltransferase